MVRHKMLLIIMLLLVSIMSFSAYGYYNTSYNYRRNVSILNNSQTIKPIILNLSEICGIPQNCQSDYGDIMITYAKGLTEVLYPFEFLDSKYKKPSRDNISFIQLIIPDTSGNIFVYFNSTAENPKNSTIFQFFETFENFADGQASNTWGGYNVSNAARLLEIETSLNYDGIKGVRKKMGSNPTACKNVKIGTYPTMTAEIMIYNETSQDQNQGSWIGLTTIGSGSCNSESAGDMYVGLLNRANYFYKIKNEPTHWITNGTFLKNKWNSMRIVMNSDYNAYYGNSFLLRNETSITYAPIDIGQIKFSIGYNGFDLSALGVNKHLESIRISNYTFQSYPDKSSIVYGGLETPAANLVIQSVELVNQSKQDWGLTFTQFTNPFMINVNATFEDLPASDAQCNYTVLNTSHIFFNEGGNRTLTNDDSLEFLIDNDDILNLQNDRYFFKLCHEPLGTAKNVQVYINDNSTIYKTISNTVIPSCDTGFHEERFMFNDYIASKQLNLSLRCSGCTGVNNIRVIKLSDYPYIHNIESSRTHSIIENEVLYYNSTSSLFEDNIFHVFSLNGNLTMNISCNTTDASIEIDILGQQPVAEFFEIIADDTEYQFNVNNTITESAANFTIIGDCSGAIITDSQLNITYNSNDTLIKSVNTESITLTSTDLNSDVLYNAILWCNADNNNTILVRTFWANDTVLPTITWTIPKDDNTSTHTINTSFTTNILFSDVNLFAYNCTLINPNDIIKYTWSLSNINTSTYSLQQSYTPEMLGIWKINCTLDDDHTNEKIPNYKYKTDDRKLIFEFEKTKRNKETEYYNISFEYEGTYDIDSTAVIKKDDRYEFEYNFRMTPTELSYDVIKHKFRIKGKSIVYREYSSYTAHVVFPVTKNWGDLESPDILSYTVKDCGVDCYEIDMRTLPTATLHFTSFGGLNSINEVRIFNVTAAPVSTGTNTTLSVGVCPGTEEGMSVLWLVIGLCVAFIVIALYFRMAIPGILSSIGLIVTSWYVSGCEWIIGFIVAGLGIMMLLAFMFSDWW